MDFTYITFDHFTCNGVNVMTHHTFTQQERNERHDFGTFCQDNDMQEKLTVNFGSLISLIVAVYGYHLCHPLGGKDHIFDLVDLPFYLLLLVLITIQVCIYVSRSFFIFSGLALHLGSAVGFRFYHHC